MVKIQLICVGRLKENFYISACAEYIKRMSAFCSFSLIEIDEERLSQSPSEKEIAAALKKEGERILSSIPQNSRVTALCIEGKKMSSEKLGADIAKCMTMGYNHLAYIIGGSFGLCDEVKSRADLRLSISDMTFPHHLARVIVLEQLYRAFQINNNGKYHK